MLVSGLVQVRLAAPGDFQALFKLGPCDTALQDPVVLLGVDIERLLHNLFFLLVLVHHVLRSRYGRHVLCDGSRVVGGAVGGAAAAVGGATAVDNITAVAIVGIVVEIEVQPGYRREIRKVFVAAVVSHLLVLQLVLLWELVRHLLRWLLCLLALLLLLLLAEFVPKVPASRLPVAEVRRRVDLWRVQ